MGWYEVLVYCNRRSLGEGLTPVYSIKGSTNPDDWGPVPASIDPDWSAVTMNDANGYRLPTSEEWVYAAAGGDPAQPDWSYTYAGSNVLDEVAWHSGNRGSLSYLEVKQKKPNRLGLYDMSGNVLEWCWDADSDSTKRRVRGGGTGDTDDDAYKLSGDGWRSWIILNANTGVGLRVVRSQ